MVGTGRIAEVHLSALSRNPLADLASVCDRDNYLADRAARNYATVAEYDFASMLERRNLDAVHILTPAETHTDIVEMALAAGIGLVIVEKPAAPSLEAARRMVAFAEQCSALVTEDHNYRFNTPVERLLAVARSGALGKIGTVEVRIAIDLPATRYNHDFEARRIARNPGGVLREFLPHFCYLAKAFVPDVEIRQASFSKSDPDTVLSPDGMLVTLGAPGRDYAGHLQFTSRQYPITTTITVRGERGWAEADLQYPSIRVTRDRGIGAQLSPLANQWIGGAALMRASVSGFAAKLRGSPIYEGIPRFIDRTYRQYRSGGVLPVTHADLLKTAALIDDVLEKAT
ncbi:MAG: Gfo/Idh/MocA family oxidoreductase [Mycolicibacterium sp.]|nr:Gfo/Idh/MocA family oxidoreductase [Mycolicibacterium sp.]